MHTFRNTLFLLSAATVVLSQGGQETGLPGYFTNYTTLPGNNTFSFGSHYAVIHGDVTNDLSVPIANTTQGQEWLSALNTWVNAVHAQNPRPLTFFTRIYYENSHYPDVKPGSPYARFLASSGVKVGPGRGNPNTTVQDSELEGSPLTQLYKTLVPVNDSDIVLEKTRYYAGFGNNLEHILQAQSIDTVILSGIRTSGVILTTAIQLTSLNYQVYVISNATIETPNPLGSEVAQSVDQSIKQGVLPIVPVEVITLEQALGALNRSGPAVY